MMKNIFRKIVQKIFGAKRPRRYSQLFEELRQVRPLRILEVGTWKGGRAEQMIRAAQQLRPGERIEYYGFDLFEGMTREKFEQEISKWPPKRADVEARLSGTGAMVRLFMGDTMETMPRAAGELPRVDFVFIDGGHSLATVANDWRWVSEMMHGGTVVIFDDYWPHRVDAGAKPTVDAIDRERYNVEILPVVDRFDNDEFGKLEIYLAKVTQQK